MAGRAGDIMKYLPPRPLTPAERRILDEWLAAAGDVASAYVSQRESDDPALYRRIVVIMNPQDGPAHTVHAPAAHDIWVVFSPRQRQKIRRFGQLQAALNFIRPVLPKEKKQASRTLEADLSGEKC